MRFFALLLLRCEGACCTQSFEAVLQLYEGCSDSVFATQALADIIVAIFRNQCWALEATAVVLYAARAQHFAQTPKTARRNPRNAPTLAVPCRDTREQPRY